MKNQPDRKAQLYEIRQGCADTIVLARGSIQKLEKRVNMWGEPISPQIADEGIAHQTREVHLALAKAQELGLPLPRGVKRIGTNIEAKHLDAAKAHYNQVEKNWQGQLTFEW